MHSAEGHRLLTDVLTVLFIVLFFLLPSSLSVYLENRIHIFILQCWLCRVDSCISNVCFYYWGSCFFLQSSENILLPSERFSPFCITTLCILNVPLYICIFLYVCLKITVLRSFSIQGWYTLPCIFISVCVCTYVYTCRLMEGGEERGKGSCADGLGFSYPLPRHACCAE